MQWLLEDERYSNISRAQRCSVLQLRRAVTIKLARGIALRVKLIAVIATPACKTATSLDRYRLLDLSTQSILVESKLRRATSTSADSKKKSQPRRRRSRKQ